MRLHGFLRDQRLIAGLGRRLANEVCHRAKLSPFASTGKLDRARRRHASSRRSAPASARASPTSGAATTCRAPKDRPGNVHGRAGEPCPVCGDDVRSVEYTRYRVDYCPTCQTGGKVLADNTTCKFLK